MRAAGSRLPQARLNETLVKRIREEYEAAQAEIKRLKPKASVVALAKEYGVTRQTITRAINGENWGHVR